MDQPTSSRPCTICGQAISPLRLEALPNVTVCVKCAQKFPPSINTANLDLSEASPINRNGFAPKD